MKIAVTSQNYRTVTPHAGKTRRFLIFQVTGADTGNPAIAESGRLDLPLEQSMHHVHGAAPHPLDAMDMIVAGSCGAHFQDKMRRRGVAVVVTGEKDPEAAIRAALADRPIPA